MHVHIHSLTHARTHACTHVRTHTHTERERETALTPVSGEGKLCNVKGQESVVNKRLKVYTNGTINIQRVHVHSVRNHEEPQHAWMHVLRHTCRYNYIHLEGLMRMTENSCTQEHKIDKYK